MDLLKAKFVNGPDGCLLDFRSEKLEDLFRKMSGGQTLNVNFAATEVRAPSGDVRMERNGLARMKCWDIRDYLNQSGMVYAYDRELLVDFNGSPNIIPVTTCGLKDGITIRRGNTPPVSLKTYTRALGSFLKKLTEQARACEIELVVKKVERA